MIRLSGNEALVEAYYADLDPETLDCTMFYIEREGDRILLDPREALEMVDRRALEPKEIICEALSVWEHFGHDGFSACLPFLHVRLGSRVVLVLTRDHGTRLAKGVRGFAVLSPVFGRAVLWAKSSPVTVPRLDRQDFMDRLRPRLRLRKQEWLQNGDLRRHARVVAKALADLFGIDLESVRECLRARKVVNFDGEFQSHGGEFLDIVLERIGLQ